VTGALRTVAAVEEDEPNVVTAHANWLFGAGCAIGATSLVLAVALTGDVLDNYLSLGGDNGISPFITPSAVLAILGAQVGFIGGLDQAREGSVLRKAVHATGGAALGVVLGAMLGGLVSFAAAADVVVVLLVIAVVGLIADLFATG